MDENSQDSFELFADTLTITLGCILFIALLLVTITRSHQMDKSGLFHFERRSELLSRQISLAEDSVKTVCAEGIPKPEMPCVRVIHLLDEITLLNSLRIYKFHLLLSRFLLIL